MDIQFGDKKTEYGPGVQINLTGDEIASAIRAYLVAVGVNIQGASTTFVNDALIKDGAIYVDPSGSVIADGVGWSGRGNKY
jgi:hypothetical protein